MNKRSIQALIKQMTLEEKVGQLHQLPPFFFGKDRVNEVAGPFSLYKLSESQVWNAGSILGTAHPQEMKELQRQYLERNRLKIPLMFMADIIHGYKTIFPIPLAMAATFDSSLAKTSAMIAAKEATTSGISVTFSPMADLARDARWGRVMESSGENPFVNYQITKAMVEGYQGSSLKDSTTLAACGKHVAAYGAAISGKDYTQAEISKHTLYQYYLEGYRACIDANASLMMAAFNVVEGIPSTVNKDVLVTMLRNHLRFKGVLISDYDSLKEAVQHRVATDEKEAAKLGLEAMLDIEMTSAAYQNFLPSLIKEKKLDETLLDKAVYRVLKLKDDLGLFDNPYRGVDEALETSLPLSPLHMKEALNASYNSIILLKNEQTLLPLSSFKDVVFVGSLLNEKNLLGAWSWHGEPSKTSSIAEALLQRQHHTMFATDDLTTLSEEERALIQRAKKVIVVVGERSIEFGEARSKVNPTLATSHIHLIQLLAGLNASIITIVIAGRPLIITDIVNVSSSILYSFYLGSTMANAILDTLIGINNPSGRLPMTLPSHLGQLPLFEDLLPTGRPYGNKPMTYTSHFIDGGNTPLYRFGYGLSYSSFTLSSLKLWHQSKDEIIFETFVKNTSEVEGKTVIFVYLTPPVVGIALPSKILVGFLKLHLGPQQGQRVTLPIETKHLQYYTPSLKRLPFSGSLSFSVSLDGNTSLPITVDVK